MNNDRFSYLLDAFVGLEISQIRFVRDYVEIASEDKTIQFMATPRIYALALTTRFPEAPSYQHLADLIGKTIVKIVLAKGIYEFSISNGTRIEVDQHGGAGGETFFTFDNFQPLERRTTAY